MKNSIWEAILHNLSYSCLRHELFFKTNTKDLFCLVILLTITILLWRWEQYDMLYRHAQQWSQLISTSVTDMKIYGEEGQDTGLIYE